MLKCVRHRRLSVAHGHRDADALAAKFFQIRFNAFGELAGQRHERRPRLAPDRLVGGRAALGPYAQNDAVQNEAPNPATEFYDAVIVEKFSKIPSDGRGAWGIGRAKIDQQNTRPICCFRQKASLKFHGTRAGYARCWP